MRRDSIRLISVAVALGGCLTMVSVSVDAAFSTASFSIKKKTSTLSMSMDTSNLMEKIPTLPNPFSKFTTPELESGSGIMGSDPELMVAKAKAILSCDLGVKDPSLLSEDFIWIGPTLEKPLGKTDYLAAGRFFNLRAAFPDLDYRAHDFRVDESDPLTIRITSRPTGTMLGALRLRNEVVPPTGKPWRGPPEAISITFDAGTGKVVKLCSGFSMDRFVGNTNGLTGVNAAATVAGMPPSDFEVLPITIAISNLFGRPRPAFKESTTLLAPFPETVMIQLVKGILAANLAADDPTLLAPEFVYYTPYVDPIKKKEFLQSYARQEFGGSEPELSNFRVDPFDPYRVWVDVKPVGQGFEGPPQAYSFTFEDDGFCTRMSAGAVMDPSIGNTGGLSGVEGIKYATGSASPSLATRPLPLVLGRLKKKVLSPVTKIEVDEYKVESSKTVPKDVFNPPEPKPSPPPAAAAKSPLQKIQKPAQKAQPPVVSPLQKIQKPAPKAQARVVASPEKPKPPVAQPPQPKPDFFASVKTPAPREAPKPKPSGPSSAQKAQMAADQKSKIEEQKRAEASSTERALERARLEAEQKKASAAEEARRAAGQARKVAAQKLTLQAEEKEAAEEEARSQAEESRRTAEEKSRLRVASEARKEVAEQNKRELEGTKAAQTEAVRVRAERERSRLAAEARKKLAEQKNIELEKTKAAQAEAMRVRAKKFNAEAERKRQEAAEKRAKAEQMRKEAEKRRKVLMSQKAPSPSPRPSITLPKPSKPVQPSGPRPTLQLSSIFGGRPNKLDKAPAGVPTIVAWKLRRDGGITGQIFGSFNFKDGQRVETSEIARGEIESGYVVTTDSGSRYFLSSESVKSMRDASQKEASKNAPPEQMNVSKPRPTIRLTQLAKEREAKRALDAVEQGTPRSTFSLAALFGFGDDDSKTDKSSSGAPPGVPSMGRWRENRDKTITGFITGSPTFAEGEQVTTSPIARGNISAGEVVVTNSGSKYFLE